MAEHSELEEALEIDRYLYDGNKDLRELTQECYRYATHDQWDQVDKDKLISQQRPVLEIDIISPKLNTLVGIEHDFRSGFEAKPFEGGDRQQALIATFMLKHLNSNSQMDRVFSRVNKDVATCGRGFIDNHVRQGEDFMGESRPRRDSPFRVKVDPQGLEPDQSDWNYMSRDVWMTNAQIKARWPEADIREFTPDMTPQELAAAVEDDLDYFQGQGVPYNRYIDPGKAKRRVPEIYERKHLIKDFILNTGTGRVFTLQQFLEDPQMLNLFGFIQFANQRLYEPKSEKELFEVLQSARGIEGVPEFGLIQRPVKEIHMSIFTAGVMLEKAAKLPYRHNGFPIIAVFGYLGERQDGRLTSSGIVQGLMGVQDEKNKRRSDALDILNRAPRAGGYFRKNRGVTKQDLMDLQDSGEWVGFDGPWDQAIHEREQKYLPILNNIADLELRAEADAVNISGINLPLQGIPSSAKESGIAIQTRIKQGLAGVSELLGNLDLGKIRTLEQCFSHIQQYYPPEKIRRIIGNEQLEVDDQAIQQFLDNYRIMKYDVVIKEEDSPTARTWKLAKAAELLQYGVPHDLIMEEVIRLSDFPNSDRIVQEIQQRKLLMAMTANSEGEPQQG